MNKSTTLGAERPAGAIIITCDKCGGLVSGRTKQKIHKCECPPTAERTVTERPAAEESVGPGKA